METTTTLRTMEGRTVTGGRNGRALLFAITVGLQSAPGLVEGQTFINTAHEQGLEFPVNSDVEGTGVSFYDFDNDGWDDITVGMWNDSVEFHRNVEGQFQRVPSFIDGDVATRTVLWVDYDNDGALDLFFSTGSGTHRLYRNDGAFHFTDVSAEAGFQQIATMNYGASFGDYDRDGDLDLYVCNYESGGEEDFARLNHLYRNNGDGTFTDVTLEAGVGDGIQQTFSSVWFDADHDGWPDLYVQNDRLQSDNSFYHNNGDGTFTNIAATNGTLAPNASPMTLTVGDVDNNGGLDVFQTTTGADEQDPGIFLVDQGEGNFADQGPQFHLDLQQNSWGATWVDHDNDMYQDLYVATGPPLNASTEILFMRNLEGTDFAPAPEVFPGDHQALSLSVARGDVDNDGRYDLFVQNLGPAPGYLWQCTGGGNNHVKITPHGTVSNRMAIGTWMRVYSGGIRQTQYTLCGENHLGQNSQHHIFGLGHNEVVDSVEVEYVSGHIDRYYHLAVGQSYDLTEGETYTVSITALGATTFCAGGEVVLDAGEHHRYLWSTGDTTRYITVSASGTFTVTVRNEHGIAATSDAVAVTVTPSPFIAATVQQPSCNAAEDGGISLANLTGVPVQSVDWDNGLQGDTINGLGGGDLSYAYTDANGCTASGVVTLIAPPLLETIVETTPAGSGNDGTVSVFIFGGTPPYTITLDGQPGTSPFTGLGPGTYQVTVTDTLGCAADATAEVDASTGMSSPERGTFSVFPNPSSGLVNLTIPAGVSAIRLTDLNGRSVYFERRPPGPSIDLGGIAGGTYILEALVNGVPRYRASVVLLRE